MPKRTDIRKVLVIGSGPIVIGQAAEFDYAGTQACLALKEEGYEVVLCNSNPATIMTDTSVADKVYMEPLTLEYIAKIIRYERPDAILPSIGATKLTVTHLNLLDGTVEGVKCEEDRVFSVQYHPESAPGPQDSAYLFDRFISMMEKGKRHA